MFWDWEFAFSIIPTLLQGLKITILATVLGAIVAAGLGLVFAILFLTAAREEAFLRHGFGPHYDDYAAQVPRMVPAGRFHSPAKVSFDTDALMRNAADALVFLTPPLTAFQDRSDGGCPYAAGQAVARVGR